MTTHHDVVVLGAGPGGYVAAIRAAQLGLRVAVVEERFWGGVCLSVGCIPSKALLRNAELAHIFTHQADTFGMSGDVTFDYGAAFDRSRTLAADRVNGVHHLLAKNHVEQLYGRGTFQDAHTLGVELVDGGTQTVTFDNAIIATGASVRLLPGVVLSENVVTYERQILSRDLPESIVIIGAGAIGVEFAYILANYGVAVTVVEYLDHVLPNEDADVAVELERQLTGLGVRVLTGTAVTGVDDRGDGVHVTGTGSDGRPVQLAADRVLVSVGFAPRVDGFGLETTGVTLARGAIAVDDHLRTSVPHLFAIGDVTAKLQLAHVAGAQGVVAAETIAGAPTTPMGDYRMMPRATFCQPQVASFGLTEAQARAETAELRVSRFPFTANGKAHGLAEPRGFVKLVADGDGRLLGGHLIGPDVSELLPELSLAQRWGLTAEQISRTVHTHPTLSEALLESARGLASGTINL
ncbi:dihydrolipoyl dehydrogenase [Georgenia subflava]|uniref:Dihydrolipoyl dehydrogenase n=1 Tax=Georgenia subflava TaxID=1622177 RepID=A0A6N7EJ09_9MICO|nr:dihydrolipoyl dehydrogenase [Georgenia subflava]MPV37411.1 dihydrolipoyl dehydrogenase [Georgenia subflava]